MHCHDDMCVVDLDMFFFRHTCLSIFLFFFFSSRRRHTRFDCDWSSDVCSSDLPALRVMAWILIFQVFTSVLGQVLLACHREKVTLRIVIVVLLVTLGVGWPLISHFGLRGAAITLVLTRLIASIQHYIPVSGLFSGFPLGKIAWKPVIAASCMAAYFAAATNLEAVLRGVSATLIYGAALFALAILAPGPPGQFKNKYLVLGSE